MVPSRHLIAEWDHAVRSNADRAVLAEIGNALRNAVNNLSGDHARPAAPHPALTQSPAPSRPETGRSAPQ